MIHKNLNTQRTEYGVRVWVGSNEVKHNKLIAGSEPVANRIIKYTCRSQQTNLIIQSSQISFELDNKSTVYISRDTSSLIRLVGSGISE